MAVFGRQLRVTPELPLEPEAELQAARAATARGASGAINLDNILMLIPAEIVTIYLTGKGIVSAAGEGASASFVAENWLSICFWASFVACFVFRAIATKPVGQVGLFQGVNWSVVAVTLVAFFLWAHAVSAPGPVFASFSGSYAAFFATILGVIAPKLVRA